MSRFIFAAAIAAMCIGMVLVYAGVLGSGLIVPGAVLIGIGMALAAMGGIMSVMRGAHPSRAADPAGEPVVNT